MNIFISNLSYAITDGDLNELFSDYGDVSSAKVIMDRETGKSRGFGFVVMQDDTAAKSAIEDLKGAEYDGKMININEARPKAERAGSGGGGNFGGNRRRY